MKGLRYRLPSSGRDHWQERAEKAEAAVRAQADVIEAQNAQIRSLTALATEQASQVCEALEAKQAAEAQMAGMVRPIRMQDVRLRVGEGKLTPQDVLAGCNAELRARTALAVIGGGDG